MTSDKNVVELQQQSLEDIFIALLSFTKKHPGIDLPHQPGFFGRDNILDVGNCRSNFKDLHESWVEEREEMRRARWFSLEEFGRRAVLVEDNLGVLQSVVPITFRIEEVTYLFGVIVLISKYTKKLNIK